MLIDFEMGTVARESNNLGFNNQPFKHLFCELREAQQGEPPSALEIDMGYLAALLFELKTGIRAKYATKDDLAGIQGAWPFFAYQQDELFVRRIDYALDIDALAHKLSLHPLDGHTFTDPNALALAKQTIRHGGYVDEYDLSILRTRHPESCLEDSLDILTRLSFEQYKRQVRYNGLDVEFKTLEDQPDELSDSTLAQVRDIPNKIQALGCHIVAYDEQLAQRYVQSFTHEEIEYLAYLEHRRWCEERKAAGWVYGEKKDIAKRRSDSLLPYDELSEGSREYNRAHARQIPELLRRAGLGILRSS